MDDFHGEKLNNVFVFVRKLKIKRETGLLED